MAIYASRPGRLAGQLIGDVFVLCWGVAWALVGIFVHQVVEVLAVRPGRPRVRPAGW